MKVAVLGAGSIGLVPGVLLTHAGVDVTLIDGWAENVKALREKGGQIIGDLEITVPVKAVGYGEVSGTFDLVLLVTKQNGIREAIECIRPHLSPDFAIVSMCNGVPEDLVCKLLGKEHVIGCSVYFPASMRGPGLTELTSNFRALNHVYAIGECTGAPTERTYAVAKILENVGPVEITDNIWGMKWTKVMHNCAWSGMSVVLGAAFGEVSENDTSYAATRYLVLEAAQVMEKMGIKPVEWLIGGIIPTVDALSFSSKGELYSSIPQLREQRKGNRGHASMLLDIWSGRSHTEVEDINGKVVAAGRQYGVSTPFNEKVVEIVHKIERGELTPSWDNLKLFDFPALPD